MTFINTSTMVFIGNLPPMDNDESDWDTDAAGSIAGTYSSFGDLQMVDITNNDVNEDGAIYDDEAGGPDFVTYTRDGTNYTEVPDATITYFATVTEDDGTVHNIEVVVVQMTNGDVFVGDMQNLGNLDNLTIRTIELTAPNTTSAAGYNTYQTTTNTTVCFAAGTLIDTPKGPVRVETLRKGDLVTTWNGDAQPIRWIGSTRPRPVASNAPVLIAPGALGPDMPGTALRVSPQHRILVRSAVAWRMFGTSEVLVAAHRMLSLPGFSRNFMQRSVRYWHLLLDRHDIVRANGMWAETLLPGKEAIAVLDAISPQVFRPDKQELQKSRRPARLIPAGHRARQLIRRHRKNGKPLFEAEGVPVPTREPA